jgi:hypothetical protein
MERPKIVANDPVTGEVIERDMDDKEFAEYKARIEAMHDKIEELEAKLKVRTNKLANP